MNKITKLAGLTAIALAGTVFLAGCSNDTSTPVATGSGVVTSSVTLANLNGQTVTALVGSEVYISTGGYQNDAVDGVSSDATVAKFIKGEVTSKSTTAPTIKVLKAGKVEITLTVDKQEIKFTLDAVTEMAPATPAPEETVEPNPAD